MDDAEKVLNDTLAAVIDREGLKDPEVIIRPLSTDAANFTSTLYVITVKSMGREDLELFAKVACASECIRRDTAFGEVYKRERLVYETISKVYDTLQRQSNVPEKEMLTFPKFFASNDGYLKESLILENLMAKGYTTYDRFRSVTWEYASAAICELAKLHALSYAFAEKNPHEFDKVVKNAVHPFNGCEENMFQTFKNSESVALEATSLELRGKLREFFTRESTVERFYENFKPIRRPVLTHGDYRPSNLMHKMTNEKLEKIVLVDYQTLHCGSPVTDLLFFISCGTDGAFRKRHYKQLIDQYYQAFSNFLEKLGLDSEKLYPMEEFYGDLKERLTFGLLVAALALPMVLVETKNAPTFQADTKLSNFVAKPKDEYKRRLREFLDDYVEWGVI